MLYDPLPRHKLLSLQFVAKKKSTTRSRNALEWKSSKRELLKFEQDGKDEKRLVRRKNEIA